GIVDEALDFFRGRRQAVQIEGGPANEGAPVGLGVEGQPLLPQLVQEEAIDRRAHRPALNARRLGAPDRLEGPPGAIVGREEEPVAELLRLGPFGLRAVRNPAPERLSLRPLLLHLPPPPP